MLKYFSKQEKKNGLNTGNVMMISILHNASQFTIVLQASNFRYLTIFSIKVHFLTNKNYPPLKRLKTLITNIRKYANAHVNDRSFQDKLMNTNTYI